MKKIIGILLVMLVALSGCGNNGSVETKNNVDDDIVYYNTYDEEKNVIVIEDEAFEVIKDMEFSVIKDNIAPELYIAHFGYKEVKDYQGYTYEPETENEITVLEFEDVEGKQFIIFPENSELVCKEIPRGSYDREYLKELMYSISEENIEDYLDEFINAYTYDKSNPISFQNGISLVGHEFVEKDSRKILALYFDNGESLKHRIIDGEYSKKWDEFNIEEFLAKNNIISDDIENFIKSNGYTLIKHKLTNLNDDEEDDYIIIANNEKTSKLEILKVDGKTKDIISSANLPENDFVKPENIIINQIPETDEYLLVYSDTESLLGVYSYSNDVITDIRIDFQALPKTYYDNNTKSFYFYYPEENKTYVMKIEDYMQDNLVKAYINGEDIEASICSNGYRLIDVVENEITVETLPSCFLLCNAYFATVEQKFRWESGRWKIVSSNWDYIDGIVKVDGISDSHREEWFANKGIKITKDNINDIFNITKPEAFEIFGEPNSTEGDGEPYLIYDNYTLVYMGEGWGPSAVILFSDVDEVFDVKIGDTFDKVKEKLGKPTYEGEDDEEGIYEKIMTFNIDKHYKLMVEGNDDKAQCITITTR